MRFLLFPFAFLYDIITSFRNYLYDNNIGFFKQNTFDVFTISVGNLAVGGTGKTPHVEYLIKLLHQKFKIATLSRGYGRKTKGIIIADNESTANDIGDESMQYLSDFYPKIHVAVGEERSVAIPNILHNHPETQIVLLDDAFQHRKVKPNINILITDYNKPFFRDYIMPMGLLRERRSNAKRADIVIVSKCPADIDYKMEYYKMKMKKYVRNKTPILFTSLKYQNPIHILDQNITLNSNSEILLVSGIANPKTLIEYVNANFKLIKHIEFPDHHNYSNTDFAKIFSEFNHINSNNKAVLTTKKDIMKWKNSDISRHLSNIDVFYLPVEIFFIQNEKFFQNYIFKRLK